MAIMSPDGLVKRFWVNLSSFNNQHKVAEDKSVPIFFTKAFLKVKFYKRYSTVLQTLSCKQHSTSKDNPGG